MPVELRADRVLIAEAVRQHFCALGHATFDLRAGREVVWDAVRQHG